MINLHIKFEVSMLTHYEDMKGNAKCRNWVGLGVGSPAMSPFDRVHTTSYSTLIETMHLSCTVFELQQVICQKSPILTYQPASGTHFGGDPIQILPRPFASENWSPCAITWHCFHNSTFSYFDTIQACDGQTDRRTYSDGIYHASMVSCSKKFILIAFTHFFHSLVKLVHV